MIHGTAQRHVKCPELEPEPEPEPVVPKGPRSFYRVLMLQRTCISCGAPEIGPHGKTIQRPADQPLPNVACSRCGSHSVLVTDSETVTLYIHEHDWLAERPRRGRPPKALVAQRLKAKEGT